MRKLPTGLEGLGSVCQTCPICQLRINLYTCKSNKKQLYFQKYKEGPVSTLLVGHRLTNKVRANEGGESVACSKWLAPIHYLQTRCVYY